MTFTYNQPWSATRDYVRFLINDRVSTNHQYEDEELDSLLLQWGGDARMAAADALDAWAAELSRNAIKYYVTGFGLDRTRTAEFMLKTAKHLRDEARKVPFEFESVLDHHVTMHGEDWSNYITTAEDDGPESIP